MPLTRGVVAKKGVPVRDKVRKIIVGNVCKHAKCHVYYFLDHHVEVACTDCSTTLGQIDAADATSGDVVHRLVATIARHQNVAVPAWPW